MRIEKRSGQLMFLFSIAMELDERNIYEISSNHKDMTASAYPTSWNDGQMRILPKYIKPWPTYPSSLMPSDASAPTTYFSPNPIFLFERHHLASAIKHHGHDVSIMESDQLLIISRHVQNIKYPSLPI